jgi:F0F1-type ATP synthase alpha subunit
MATIRDTRDLSDESKEQLKAAIERFKSTFRPSAS